MAGRRHREFDAKPVIDAVNDSISALSDLVRSLRTHGRKTAEKVSEGVRKGARKVKGEAAATRKAASRRAGEVVAGATAAKADVVGRLQRAWNDLRGRPAAGPADGPGRRPAGRRRRTSA